MHGERALDADPEADLADRERLADAVALTRPMTTPWNAWMRERLPSTTLTLTLRVSPARNSGMSERSDAASTLSSVCM